MARLEAAAAEAEAGDDAAAELADLPVLPPEVTYVGEDVGAEVTTEIPDADLLRLIDDDDVRDLSDDANFELNLLRSGATVDSIRVLALTSGPAPAEKEKV